MATSKWLPFFAVFVLSAGQLLSVQISAFAEYTIVSGNLTADDDVQSTPFSTTQTENYLFFTTSYAGGTNADGTTTAAGGFDPILTLFDSSGNTINYNDDDTTGFVGTDPTTGLAADSYFAQVLGPGTYTLSISEYDNFATTNSSSWSEAGNSDFTSNFSNPFNPLPGPFLDQTGDQRTSSYTYDIVSTPLPTVPEPSGAEAFAAFAIVAFGFALRNRIRKSKTRRS